MTITISINSCRVCLKLPLPKDRQSLNEIDPNINKKIGEIFTECSSINIPENFKYVNNICKPCLNNLQNAYNFRSLCQKTEDILQLFIRSQSENKNRVIISINNGKTYRLPQSISLKVIKKEVIIKQQAQDYLTSVNITNDDNDDMIIPSDLDSDTKDDIFEEENSIDIDKTVFPDSPKEIKLIKEKDLNQTESQNDLEPSPNQTQILKFEPWMSENFRTTNFKCSNGLQCEIIQSDNPGETPTLRIPLKKNKNVLSISSTKSLVCEICGNVYSLPSQLRDHLQWHNGDKDFECEICGKKFLRREYMVKHLKTHSGIKPFKCSFCSRKFFENGQRRAHERTHSGVRKHKCRICKKEFMYSQALKKHFLIHEEIKLYNCEICNKEFRLMHHLKQHLATKIHQFDDKIKKK